MLRQDLLPVTIKSDDASNNSSQRAQHKEGKADYIQQNVSKYTITKSCAYQFSLKSTNSGAFFVMKMYHMRKTVLGDNQPC